MRGWTARMPRVEAAEIASVRLDVRPDTQVADVKSWTSYSLAPARSLCAEGHVVTTVAECRRVSGSFSLPNFYLC